MVMVDDDDDDGGEDEEVMRKALADGRHRNQSPLLACETRRDGNEYLDTFPETLFDGAVLSKYEGQRLKSSDGVGASMFKFYLSYFG